ncbi:MFS transporter [Gephyromycinifex aptenodytis]|uniref:MFS transporter n=1 Tax=Gephyromycinifex aptenodytis TaxID=2716227 RepID=UPI0014466A65|nr:MFS transporter [Gephyromycinifex aptenodytis]
MSGRAHAPARSAVPPMAALLCWLTVALEGFDLVAFGAVIPTLLETAHLGMGRAEVTMVATISLVGVGVGAAACGPFIDRYGRRLGLFISVAMFSLFTLAVPLAGSVAMLAAVRFVAGLGLGACMPTAIALMNEASSVRRRASATTVTMTGYHVGAVAMTLLALAVGRDWHLLFYGGGTLGLLVLPLVWFGLEKNSIAPPSPGTPAAARPLRELRTPGAVAAMVSACVASFMGLLLVYGLNTWLPQIMRDAGYSLTSSLSLLLIMNAGAVAGLLLAGVVADRRGIRGSTVAWFAASALFLLLLSTRIANPVLLHAVVCVTGLFVFSAQGLVYALVAHLFEERVRGTALGMASGVGRLGAITGPAATGALASAGLVYPFGFYFFGGVAVLAAIAVRSMPAHLNTAQPESAAFVRS